MALSVVAAPSPQPAHAAIGLLRDVWHDADRLFDADVTAARAHQVPISLRMPFLFYLGHLPAFASNKLLLLPDGHDLRVNPHYDHIFSRGIDPDVDDPSKCHDHPDAPASWPTWPDVCDYRDAIRLQINTLIASHSHAVSSVVPQSVQLSPRLVRMVAEHEAMHIETLQYMLTQALRENPLPTTTTAGSQPLARHDDEDGDKTVGDPEVWSCNNYDRIPVEVLEKQKELDQWCHVDAGYTSTGVQLPDNDDDFVWDNETDTESHFVPAFSIMKHAVTVADMVRFVDAGGYRTSQWWDADDWEWVCTWRIQHPQSWERCSNDDHESSSGSNSNTYGWNILTAPGKPHWTHLPHVPVSLSLAEAKAYARWRTACNNVHDNDEKSSKYRYSVPSELQWIRAAYGSVTHQSPQVDTMQQASEGDRQHIVDVDTPLHVSTTCGAVNLVGNGWELCGSLFQRYEGFSPMREYPEYSADFFDGKHFVLKGASWATHHMLIRPSFRNFYQSRYPFVFSKFRLVRQV